MPKEKVAKGEETAVAAAGGKEAEVGKGSKAKAASGDFNVSGVTLEKEEEDKVEIYGKFRAICFIELSSNTNRLMRRNPP